MVKQLNRRLATEYPEILELNDLLSVAKKTWQQYGISAGQLAEQDAYTIELIRILVE